MDYFTLAAAPNTDLWRKPPDRDTSTAPILFTSMRNPFVIAEVTVTADWEMEWDQGGLVIFAGPAPYSITRENTNPRNRRAATTRSHTNNNDTNDNDTNDNNARNQGSTGRNNTHRSPPPPYYQHTPQTTSTPGKWVKAGLEFSAGTVNASSVSATSDGADWCLAPLALPNQPTSISSLRIKLERIGHSLWVWYQLPSLATHAYTPGAVGSTWRKLREVTWFFWGVEDKSVHVGVYASRPANFALSSTAFATATATGGGGGGGRGYSNNNSNNSSNSNNNNNQRGNGGGGGGSSSGGSGGGDGLVVEFEDLEIF